MLCMELVGFQTSGGSSFLGGKDYEGGSVGACLEWRKRVEELRAGIGWVRLCIPRKGVITRDTPCCGPLQRVSRVCKCGDLWEYLLVARHISILWSRPSKIILKKHFFRTKCLRRFQQ